MRLFSVENDAAQGWKRESTPGNLISEATCICNYAYCPSCKKKKKKKTMLLDGVFSCTFLSYKMF